MISICQSEACPSELFGEEYIVENLINQFVFRKATPLTVGNLVNRYVQMMRRDSREAKDTVQQKASSSSNSSPLHFFIIDVLESQISLEAVRSHNVSVYI